MRFGLFLAALVGAALFTTSANAASTITVCERTKMREPCHQLRYGTADLSLLGLDDKIRSFAITDGTWRLCTNAAFTGTCREFTGSANSLNGSLDQKVSSITPVRRVPGTQARVALIAYEHPGYRGRSWAIADDVPNLNIFGLNNVASSVRVLGGLWDICAEHSYKACKTVGSDVPDLRSLGLNDKLSSVRPR